MDFNKQVEKMTHKLEEKSKTATNIYKVKMTYEDVESYITDKAMVKFAMQVLKYEKSNKVVKTTEEAINVLEENGYEIELWKCIVEWDNDGIITVC